jgi:hypothetical protein
MGCAGRDGLTALFAAGLTGFAGFVGLTGFAGRRVRDERVATCAGLEPERLRPDEGLGRFTPAPRFRFCALTLASNPCRSHVPSERVRVTVAS